MQIQRDMKAGVFNRNQHVTLIISDQRQIWKELELLVFLNDHWKIMDFVIIMVMGTVKVFKVLKMFTKGQK